MKTSASPNRTEPPPWRHLRFINIVESNQKTAPRSCLGTSTFYRCDDFECPHRKRCQRLVSPWLF